MVKLRLILLSGLLLALVPNVALANDPFPGISTGQEVPGTRISGAPGQSQASFEATPGALAFSCPAGAGRGLSVDLNFTSTQSDDVVSYYCVKTWSDPETGEAAERAREQAARDAVQLQAQNKANELGIQACLPWSYTWRNGITQASGSVCAMPNVAAATPSPSASATAPSASATAPSASATAPSESSSGTTSGTTSATPTTTAPSSSTQASTASPSTPSRPAVTNSSNTPVIEDDGEEEEPSGSIRVRKVGSQYSIIINTNIGSEEVRVAAIKKGAKTIRWTVSTNDAGNVTIRSNRQLNGYRLALYYQNQELDSVRAN